MVLVTSPAETSPAEKIIKDIQNHNKRYLKLHKIKK